MASKVLGPLSGVAFLVLVIGGAIYGGEPPSETKKFHAPDQLAAAYVAQGDKIMTAVFFMGVGLALFVFFASVLKTRLDSGTAPTHCLSRAAFAGAVIFAAGAATDLTLAVAAVEAAKDKADPVAIQALAAYFRNDWVPFAVGILLLTGASALSIIKFGGLPVWLGWLAALIAIVGLIPPIGFAAFPAAGAWVLLASITMAVQARNAEPAGPPPM